METIPTYNLEIKTIDSLLILKIAERVNKALNVIKKQEEGEKSEYFKEEVITDSDLKLLELDKESLGKYLEHNHFTEHICAQNLKSKIDYILEMFKNEE